MPDFIEILQDFVESVGMAKKNEELRPLERDLEEKLMKLFRQQKRAYLEKMKKYKNLFAESMGSSESEKILDEIFMKSKMKGLIKKSTTEAYSKGIGKTVNSMGVEISFNIQSPEAVNFLENHAAEMVTKINDTTRQYIHNVIKEAGEKGWSYNKTAKKISDRFEEFAIGKPQKHIASRAHLIAIQENSMAYETGNYMAGQKMRAIGIAMEKFWSTEGGERTCEICLNNEAMGWIDFDDSFLSGDDFPPAHVACRCTLLQRRKKAA